MRRWAGLCLAVCWAACFTGTCIGSVGLVVVTNAAQLVSFAGQPTRCEFPASLTGVVTWVDTNRNLVVLQDDTGAVAMNLDLNGSPVTPGQNISIEADNCSLLSEVFPDYPYHPSESGLLNSFEEPKNAGRYYLSRVRGFIYPPASGNYTFWIASKGSSELWLSTNDSPAHAAKISSVTTGNSTRPGQWDKYPTQRSAPIFLQAGKACYIESLHEHSTGSDNLAVAWQGPGLNQSVIRSPYLSPWTTESGKQMLLGSPAATNGLFREFWINFVAGSVVPLSSRAPSTSILALKNPRLKILGEGKFPEPLPVIAGQPLNFADNHRWVEIEGVVKFASQNGDLLDLELLAGQSRVTVHVRAEIGRPAARWDNARIRVRGICEGVLSADGQYSVSLIWAPFAGNVSVFDSGWESWSRIKLTPMCEIVPANPSLAWGHLTHVHGTVIGQENTHAILIQSADTYSPFVSTNGTGWKQIAPPIEVSMSNLVLAGLAVSSFNENTLATALFDHLSGLTTNAQSVDTRFPRLFGSTVFEGTTCIMKGSGAGIGSAWDQFHFAFQPLPGSGEIIARVKSLDTTNAHASAGLMMRTTWESSSAFAGLSLTAAGEIAFQYRQTGSPRGETVVVSGYAAPCWLKLVRSFYRLPVQLEPESQPTVQSGQTVEVIGSLAWANGKPLLQNARIRSLNPMAAPSVVSVAAPVAAAVRHDPVEVSIARLIAQKGELTDINSDGAKIRGVVTFNSMVQNTNYLSIQDETAGVFVKLSRSLSQPPLKVGQLVEFEARPVNNRWRLPFEPISVKVIGSGLLPTPVVHPAELATMSRGEGRWVEHTGIVRSVEASGEMIVMGKTGLLRVRLAGATSPALERYVDSLVKVRGVISSAVENSPLLLVPGPAFVETQEPSPENPFALPVISSSSLTAFDDSARPYHRVKVAGVVTYVRDNLMFLQDSAGGVCVRIMSAPPLMVGDQVEASGFPQGETDFPLLTEASVQKLGTAPLPAPVELSPDELSEGKRDAQLVTLKALLLEQRKEGGDQVLALQSESRTFQVRLVAGGGSLPSNIGAGSQLEITGVCWTERGAASMLNSAVPKRPMLTSFELFLRTPKDFVVTQKPPWWTWKHTAAVVGSLLAILIGSLVWIRQLHQVVAERTKDLKETMAKLEEKTQISATLAERDRLASEIHDGLEQGLSGIMMQLDGVDSTLKESPDDARQYLELARNMVRFSRAEVRNSLWDLQSPALANVGLGMALAEIVKQMNTGNHIAVTTEILGSVRPLSQKVEHHLLRICQEALTNAIKHAEAKLIQVKLVYATDSVELSVADDGRGFATETVLAGMAGHLGLRNLRSRARKMGGHLDVTSAPGATLIKVTVPLNDRNGGTTSTGPQNTSQNS